MEYYLVVDKLVKVWSRERVTVKADTLDEAAKKALNGDYYLYDVDYLYETEELMDPEDSPTVEILDKSYNILTDNFHHKDDISSK